MFGIGSAELFVVLIIFLPVILVAYSKRIQGNKKLGWIIISFFLSWAGYGLFLVFTKKQENSVLS